ncbi:MAG: HNH endonuclease [Burkholderiales bacterium]|nr:HNH endonuclease [Anaerolineae bacterium]
MSTKPVQRLVHFVGQSYPSRKGLTHSATKRAVPPITIKGSKVCECGQPKKPQNKYCSECANSYSYKRVFELEAAKTDQLRRKIVIEQRGHRCERCGNEEWMGAPIPLEIDHISGDTDDNSAESLRMLCPNCHAQTETYKGANKGKSRKRQQMRRKRYADGLTW